MSIRPDDRVLEVGPGALPHPRANVSLDKRFDDADELNAQFGLAQRSVELENLVYYDGGAFPFKDNEFDYIICSHVIEHIDPEELGLFFSEMTRVARRGYLEVPNAFYEFICYTHVHKWLIGNDGEQLRFYSKSHLPASRVMDTFRWMFYNCDQDLTQLFPRYREIFFIGFEWEGHVDYTVVNKMDQLFGEKEFAAFNSKIHTSEFYKRNHPHLFPEPGEELKPPLPTARELFHMNIAKARDIMRRRLRIPV